MTGPSISWVSLLCDLITILPFIGWGVMSIFAIPSYAASGWLAPVVIAVFSTIICGLACRELFLRSRVARRKLLYVLFDEKKAAARAARVNLGRRVQGWVALACVVLTALFTALFLAAEYAIVSPAVDAGMPCACETWTARGNNSNQCCHACADDPLCLDFSDAVLANNGLAALCPPGTKRGDPIDTPKNAGFSCAADGFWMLVTTLFCVGWWIVIRFRPVAKPASVASATPDEAAL